MGKKCCAPNCRSGYAGVNMDGIPMHKFRERCKENFPRRGEWNVTSNSHICSKYFTDSDFVITPLDKRARRVEKRSSKLTYRYLNEDVFPTIFPNCPQYLSKKKRQTKNHPKDKLSLYEDRKKGDAIRQY